MRSISLALIAFRFRLRMRTRVRRRDTVPTAADAKKFIDEVNETIIQAGTEGSQAGWVSETYITDDTSALNARSNQRAHRHCSALCERRREIRQRRRRSRHCVAN